LHSVPTVKVLPWPYWTGNPYLPRFCNELESHGVSIVRARWTRLGVWRLRGGDWIHFHWPGALLMSRDRDRYKRRIERWTRRIDDLRTRGVRMCWTAHNLWPHDDPHPDLGRIARLAMVERLDHVLVHFAGAIPMLAEELGWRGPTTVVPHGHYGDIYGTPGDASATRRALRLPADGLVLLLLGYLRPYKGIGTAITAFRRVARDDDRLIIAGRPEGDVDGELAEARGERRIMLRLERIPSHEIAGYHGAADAFLMSHRASFTSGAAVMALSMGCPVIGASGPHLASLGPEPRVFTAAASDPDAIADAIERRRAAGPIDRDAIRSWTRVHLSWSLAARRAAAVFQEAAC